MKSLYRLFFWFLFLYFDWLDENFAVPNEKILRSQQVSWLIYENQTCFERYHERKKFSSFIIKYNLSSKWTVCGVCNVQCASIRRKILIKTCRSNEWKFQMVFFRFVKLWVISELAANSTCNSMIWCAIGCHTIKNDIHCTTTDKDTKY